MSGVRDFDGEYRDDPLWYKDAIIYQLHVKAFFDSDNDGVGTSMASRSASTT